MKLPTKSFNDLIFDVTCDSANYDRSWTSSLTDDNFFQICLTFESFILLLLGRDGLTQKLHFVANLDVQMRYKDHLNSIKNQSNISLDY